jgi:hypothetical protein
LCEDAQFATNRQSETDRGKQGFQHIV